MSQELSIAQYHLHKQHPEKLQFEVYDLEKYRAKSGQKAALPHSHSYYQIIWFYEEGGTHQVDFKTYTIKENMVLFIAKNQVHAFDENYKVEGKLIHFNESFFMHNDVDIFLKYNIFTKLEQPCFHMDFKSAITFSNYLGIIDTELEDRNRFGFEEVIRFLLKSLLISLERQYLGVGASKVVSTNHHQLQYLQFMELLETHYKEGLSVQAYADLLHISTKTLTTITKNIAQITPAVLIAKRQVLQAKRLVRFGSHQMNEIAFMLGFEDASYFNRFFKRYVGISPSEFRKNNS